MTQEEKELLLKDICARLPYGVIVHGEFPYSDGDKLVVEQKNEKLTTSIIDWFINGIENIKPYLRPMSSITENEEFSYKYKKKNHTEWEAYDYLNSIHIDYRGLIPMNLALEAPEGMYNFK